VTTHDSLTGIESKFLKIITIIKKKTLKNILWWPATLAKHQGTPEEI
jgi:hypothetical protein